MYLPVRHDEVATTLYNKMMKSFNYTYEACKTPELIMLNTKYLIVLWHLEKMTHKQTDIRLATHKQTDIRLATHAPIHTAKYTHRHTCIHIHTHAHTHTHTHPHTYTHINT